MSVIITVDINLNQVRQEVAREEKRALAAVHQTGESIGKRGLKLFRDLVSNWTNKPVFEMQTSANSSGSEVLVGTDDKIFEYLDKGTSVRYAIMSPDFIAKTKPGSLQSGPGRGGMVFISRKHPRPGIKARHFSDKVEQTLRREIPETLQRELKRVK
jgi:hypothetical protein